MTPDGILETVLYADDLAAAEDFYVGVLGFTLHSTVPGRHIFFRCGGQMLLIFNPRETVKGVPPSALPVPAHGASGEGHVCFAASANEMVRRRSWPRRSMPRRATPTRPGVDRVADARGW